jgi:peptidyl-tRNA hydrolase, PTH2 family
MRLGKAIAQGAHAAIMFLVERLRERPCTFSESEWIWMTQAMTKICVRVDNEEELIGVIAKARTEFRGVPTLTCCAIGPNESEEIDAVTGHLKLL